MGPAIERTLRAILDELNRLEPNFPQLAEVKSVKILTTELPVTRRSRTPFVERYISYSKGIQIIKDLNPVVERNGCYISVSVTTYAPEDEGHYPPRQWPREHYQAKDGLRYAVWSHVAAERDAIGAKFTERVRGLIADRLNALHAELGSHKIPLVR